MRWIINQSAEKLITPVNIYRLLFLRDIQESRYKLEEIDNEESNLVNELKSLKHNISNKR